MKIVCGGLLLLSCPAFALETIPWLGDQYAFDFQSAFTYSRYHKVEGASKQLKSPSNDYDLFLDVGFTALPTLDMRTEIEFAATPRQSWNWRSVAIQARYQWLDDISGDPISLTTGINVRGVPHHSLRDVSCPYASYANFELTLSVGKEWSKEGMWTMRTYGLVSVGQANRGFPWTQELAVWQLNWQDTHELSLFAVGDFGFGGKQHVDVRHFDGWAKFQHQSIDLGVAYGYQFTFYGTLTASYAYRIFAHNFPERVNFFTLAYSIPFSLF
ncbi:MAG: hypothetical protein WA347_03915 [Rhabdochlamydiaceae bacterium]|jgi:hypothetical protein